MAKRITLYHPRAGLSVDGFYGFSWTTFFFGPFPALFRGDWGMGILFVLIWLPAGIIFPPLGLVVHLVAALIYNRRYTLKLLERGYRVPSNASLSEVREMCRALQVSQHVVMANKNLECEVWEICNALKKENVPITIGNVCREIGAGTAVADVYVNDYIDRWKESERTDNNIHKVFVTNTDASDTRQCPFCAETIKKAATLCRHCKSAIDIFAV